MNDRQQSPSEGRTRVLDRALDLVEFLRERCPWDAAQTPRSLRRYLLEEAYEVVHAITESPGTLPDELGDLLLNVAFQIVIAEEESRFDRALVVEALEAKMRRRHPDLYGDGPARSWNELKQAEQDRPTDPARIPLSSDALDWAERVQRAAAEVGFDWPDPRGAIDKVVEEADEVRAELGRDPAALESEIGDLLFSAVNVARLAGVSAPLALAGATRKFQRRFRTMREASDRAGHHLPDMTLDQMEELWRTAKADPHSPTDSGT